MSFLRKPRHVWFRKALFQMHLWTGIVLGLYMFVIGTSGAILVFHDELTATPKFNVPPSNAQELDVSAIVEDIHKHYPKAQLENVSAPSQKGKFYSVLLKGDDGTFFSVNVQSFTGEIEQVQEPHWLEVIGNLHFSLFAGRTGRFLNGIGAGFLLILCLSGLVIWWPGIGRWRRSFVINCQGTWQRINYDLHSTIGFWSLALLSIWAVSGVYFIWPQQIESAINSVSSVSAAHPPKVRLPPRPKGVGPPLEEIIRQSELESAQSRIVGVDFPNYDTDALVVNVPRGEGDDPTAIDCFYFDPMTGSQLAVWHRGVNPTIGSKILFWLAPLHFGTQWGLIVKIIWSICGLGLPSLFLTGALMYWNRVLSKKWRAMRKASPLYRKV